MSAGRCTPVLCVLCTAVAVHAMTYVDILRQMRDLEHLAALPAPGVKTAQNSSYDRASRYDAGSDTYVNWGANGDADGMVSGNVMADIQGPGIIWRWWNAEALSGPVSIYLDGSTSPTVSLPFQNFFDRQTAPFNVPWAVWEAATGHDNYLPIPFAQSCRVVAGSNWGRYYHITYTTYPQGTDIPTFTATRTTEELAVMNQIGQASTQPKQGAYPYDSVPGQQTFVRTVSVGGGVGAKTTVIRFGGSGALTMIRAQPSLAGTTDEVRVRFRELGIRIYWDDDTAPSVWSPLGDFFGTAPGYNHCRTIPVSMRDNQLNAYWYMPFSSGARVELLNDGPSEQTVTFTFTVVPPARPIAEYGRFHAKWHRDAFLPTRADRECDWTLLKVTGRGRYVGVHLHVWNPNGDGYYNAKYPGSTYWWGEGDEKFFIDGEKFPSTYGTGTEDYFGYAWALPWIFYRPYHSQPLNEDNRGHISNARWHVTDNYPFQTSFEGAIEKFYGNDFPTIYAALPCWYQQAGELDSYAAESVERRISYWRSSYQVASATSWTDPGAGDVVALDWTSTGAARYSRRPAAMATDLRSARSAGARVFLLNGAYADAARSSHGPDALHSCVVRMPDGTVRRVVSGRARSD